MFEILNENGKEEFDKTTGFLFCHFMEIWIKSKGSIQLNSTQKRKDEIRCCGRQTYI